MVYLVGMLALLVVGESWLLWRVGRALGPLEQFAERLAQMSSAMHLLTETAESGFSSFAGALAEAFQPPPRRKGSRRPRTPAPHVADTALPTTHVAGTSDLRLHLSMPDQRPARYAERET